MRSALTIGLERLMRRVATEQLLLASSTTEGQNGGNIRFSSAAVEHAGTEISLLRDATVISYGAEADGIVTIARRADEAAGSDQVMLAITRDDYTLEPTLAWETLGMRGTCSAGFKLNFKGTAEQIFPGWAPGSEAGWGSYIVNPSEPVRVAFLRSLVFKSPSWTPEAFDWEKDVTVADHAIPSFAATSRDYRAFKARGEAKKEGA